MTKWTEFSSRPPIPQESRFQILEKCNFGVEQLENMPFGTAVSTSLDTVPQNTV